jgi:1-aminocyclopropane-1-carboxylate deaminase/D-cysteine desulfhydrase-like pyridoxal-dependent ACC family enzyme
MQMAKAFFQATGIAPDPIYDVSVLLWYFQAVQKEQLVSSADVLWLHSGGITGWAGFESECHELFGL